MTGPDPVAALAAQLEELRGQLARYTGETGHLRAKLAEDSGQVVMLRLEIKQLGEKIEAAIARRNADEPPAPYWPGLSREEHGTRLAELRGWVDRVALVQYPGYFGKLPPCWPNHPEAVTELSNVMTEWMRVYGDEDNRDLQARSGGMKGGCPASSAAWPPRSSATRPAARLPQWERSRPVPDGPEGPGVLPLRRGLLPARIADLQLGLGVRSRPPARSSPRVARLPGRPPGTAQPGARVSRARHARPGSSRRAALPPGPVSGRPARRSARARPGPRRGSPRPRAGCPGLRPPRPAVAPRTR